MQQKQKCQSFSYHTATLSNSQRGTKCFDLAVAAINVSRTFLLRPGSEGLGWRGAQIYVGRGAVVCVWRRGGKEGEEEEQGEMSGEGGV